MKNIRKFINPKYANYSLGRLGILLLVTVFYYWSMFFGLIGIAILIDILFAGEYQRLPILSLLLFFPLRWLKNYISTHK